MKLYINLARAVAQSLEMIFEEGRYADKVIEKVLKQNSKWGARDRRFIAETTYDIVRWYRLLQTLTDTPANDYWSLIGCWCILHNIELPDWEEFRELSPKKINERLEKFRPIRRIHESIPDWLDNLGEQELGSRWDEELHALNDEAEVVLRANTLKITSNGLRQVLRDEGVECSTLNDFPDALVLKQWIQKNGNSMNLKNVPAVQMPPTSKHGLLNLPRPLSASKILPIVCYWMYPAPGLAC